MDCPSPRPTPCPASGQDWGFAPLTLNARAYWECGCCGEVVRIIRGRVQEHLSAACSVLVRTPHNSDRGLG